MAEHQVGRGPDRWDVVAESYGSSPVIARLAKALVDAAEILPGESVIDLGTGTGLGLIAALESGASSPALGVDRSLGMLKLAAIGLAEAGFSGVPLIRADAAQLPLHDASFDVAVAASLWQFLAYAPEALIEWRRVLRPGGRLALSIPGPGSGASLPADLTAKYFPRLSRPAQEDFRRRASPRPVPQLAEATSVAGFSQPTVVSRSWDNTLPGPEDWWAIQWTHASRFFLQTLDSDALAMLKAEALERLVRSETGEVMITTTFTYCVARNEAP
jgi:SAM-dependent methyltransferase